MDKNIKNNLNKMGKAWYIKYLFEKYVNKSGKIPLENSKGIKARTERLPKTVNEDIEYIDELERNTDFKKLAPNSLGCSAGDLRGMLDRVEEVLFLNSFSFKVNLD